MEYRIESTSKYLLDSSERDHLEFMERVKSSLIQILLTLKEENEKIKANHFEEVRKLNAVIEEKNE
jgi:hypothetical protein